jgi:hypothetical protein
VNVPCSECGRTFGGVATFDRHRLRREDRCKTTGELRGAGYYTDVDGVWHRPAPPAKPHQTSLIDKRTIRPTRKGPENVTGETSRGRKGRSGTQPPKRAIAALLELVRAIAHGDDHPLRQRARDVLGQWFPEETA